MMILRFQSIPWSLAAAATMHVAAAHDSKIDTSNPTGVLRTITLDGSPLVDTGPFFQSLGTNGRSCASCHVPSAGWTVVPDELQSLFLQTDGLDPVFRLVDGANSPLMDVSTTAARANAYSMLLSHGVIRVGRPMPVGADFELIAVEDPWGYASASELSLFRRPLPTTNLGFLTAVMWDGRESSASTGTIPLADLPPANVALEAANHTSNLFTDLGHQAAGATVGHAQAMVPGLTNAQRIAIVEFELNLATAQKNSHGAGSLSASGALGGPEFLSTVPFYVSMNDSGGLDITGAPFNPASMNLFTAWANKGNPHRQAIARGQALFNGDFTTNTGGVFRCGTCHGVPNVGNRSMNRNFNIGTSDDTPASRYAGLPLYTFRSFATGATIRSTDPGTALTTGKFTDINKFKTPVLRGLAARAPYFHNGAAATLTDVLRQYQVRFNFTMTNSAEQDLVAFLLSL